MRVVRPGHLEERTTMSVPAAAHAKRPPDIPQLLDALERHKVRYVLAGSVGAGLYGVDIGQPGDLDVVPCLTYPNLRRLAAMLVEIEARPDAEGGFGHWESQPDGDRKWVVDESTPERLAARANWSPDPRAIETMDHLFVSRHGNFDVVPEVSGSYNTLMQRAALLSAYGHNVWVAHIDELLATLTVPRRKKDVDRVRELREIQRQQGEQA